MDVGEIAEKIVWLKVVAYAPPGSNVGAISGEMRERVLAALGESGFLPTEGSGLA